MNVIFVVDDDREWLGYYERLLKDYDVELFQDGVAVMERMQDRVPDVMILDILLVGPTGFSVLHEMQSYEDLAGVPVILISSVSVEEDMSEYGVAQIFNKGEMRPEELLEVVRSYDGKHKN
jgi:DNA-binding response OmpR family regulator